MNKLLLGFIAIYALNVYAQSPREVVQNQLEAYNAQNIGAFMKVFSDDVELWSLGDTIPSVSGLDNVKEVYADLFEHSPQLHSEVISRTIIGNKVIDYEKITGRLGSEENMLFLIMIYEVRDGKIFRATSIRE